METCPVILKMSVQANTSDETLVPSLKIPKGLISKASPWNRRWYTEEHI